MSLLNKIQAKKDEKSKMDQSNSNETITTAKIDILSSYRKTDNHADKKKEKDPKTILHQDLKKLLHKQIMDRVKDDDVKKIIPQIDGMAVEIMKQNEKFRGVINRKIVVDELINDLTGYGPINPLLLDPTITEVMINGPEQVYVEKAGKIIKTEVQFRDDEHIMSIIEKIVAPIGRRIDESSPMVDARLPDGSRVNAIIPPLALKGPTLTIRKFSKDPFKMEDLIRFGTITEDMAVFIDACVKAKLNVFVSGGTGSGKTTTLNVLSSCIPSDERIITIEDAAELQLWQEHVVSLESRPSNLEGKGEISIRDLVKNALRMRPERIIIGEVRSGEALDMLQAMNTGHDGSLATGHSNSPRDMISRLETMVLMVGIDLPVKAIREQIAGAIDVIIHQSRMKDGTRRITHITEVQGMEGDVIVLQDIFIFEQHGINEEGKIIGELKPTGIRPKFYERLETSGIYIPPTVFIENEYS
ncbi:CpaF family protein [Chengkuizengella sediminis]|uniref:CpaF family protein n=1 Tax=Chengkuizengella sediminis TaxID=1885917 RepID=UPI0013895902|nr:CpaF family protein [Chengkuizengella sediminis]NDI36377.1 CpaF family protein [Chengkuizengella sediminis]